MLPCYVLLEQFIVLMAAKQSHL